MRIRITMRIDELPVLEVQQEFTRHELHEFQLPRPPGPTDDPYELLTYERQSKRHYDFVEMLSHQFALALARGFSP